MMHFTVAIIGRPNVGKSTLFNRLVGKKLALVDDQPGVTRDRREGEARLGDLTFTIIDTAGLEEADGATLVGRMRAQTEAAMPEADAILFVIDAPHRADAGRPALRRPRAPRRQAGDRCSPTRPRARPASCRPTRPSGSASAIRSRSRPSTARACPTSTTRSCEALPELDRPAAGGRGRATPEPPRTTPSGRCASPSSAARTPGKSTLINRMLGEERLLTGPEAGHHPRFHRRRLELARSPGEAVRHGRHAQARQHRGQAREARRSPTRCAPSASPRSSCCCSMPTIPVREAGPAPSSAWSSARAARSSSPSTSGTSSPATRPPQAAHGGQRASAVAGAGRADSCRSRGSRARASTG